MSHFSLAIISPETADIDKIMEPFYEGIDMEPYVAKTKRQLIKSAREYYQARYEDCLKKEAEIMEDDKDYLPNLKRITQMTDDELYNFERERYDSECFDKEGNLISTYNPKSKYDWYEIGGRWHNLLELKEKDKNGNSIKVNQAKIKDVNFESNLEAYNDAIAFWENYVEGKDPASVGFVLYQPEYYLNKYKTKESFAKSSSTFTTFAVITPDGEWHEEGEMMMFGISINEDDEWNANYKERFLDCSDEDFMITIIDCHI